MNDIRKIMCWIFACTSLMYIYCVGIAIRRGVVLNPRILRTTIFWAIATIVFGVAWWTVWTAKASAKAWGIAASLTEIMTFIWPIVFRVRTVWPHHLGALVIGVTGLVVFSRRSSPVAQ